MIDQLQDHAGFSFRVHGDYTTPDKTAGLFFVECPPFIAHGFAGSPAAAANIGRRIIDQNLAWQDGRSDVDVAGFDVDNKPTYPEHSAEELALRRAEIDRRREHNAKWAQARSAPP